MVRLLEDGLGGRVIATRLVRLLVRVALWLIVFLLCHVTAFSTPSHLSIAIMIERSLKEARHQESGSIKPALTNAAAKSSGTSE